MMRSVLFKFAAGAALISLTPAQAPAQSCLTRAEMDGLIAYALPTVIKSTATACAPALPADAVLTVRSKQLLAELEPQRIAAFPMAKAAFKKFGESKDASSMRILDALPEQSFGPIVDAVVSEKLGSSIKPESCGDVNRIFATLSPMPAASMVDFIVEVFIVASRKDKRLRSCPGS